MDTKQTPDKVRGDYDRIAKHYADDLFHELDGKPLDREILTRFAQEVSGPVCDLGCGPGQIARYIKDQGAKDVCGIDLSPEMIAQAQQRSPDIPFSTGNMLALDEADESFGAIVAFYAIVNLPRESVPTAFSEMYRVLRSGGILLIAFHMGDHVLCADDMWGENLGLDFVYFQTDIICTQLKNVGFILDEVTERDPYPDVEHQSRRAYIRAHKPTGA